jgi:acyl-CoA synthetase (AMP-forming)/AMP-acid ligase II
VPGAKATVQDMLEYCRGKIASYKIPKFIIFLDSLPRIQGPHGDKISKPRLLELARQELDRREGNEKG